MKKLFIFHKIALQNRCASYMLENTLSATVEHRTVSSISDASEIDFSKVYPLLDQQDISIIPVYWNTGIISVLYWNTDILFIINNENVLDKNHSDGSHNKSSTMLHITHAQRTTLKEVRKISAFIYKELEAVHHQH